MLSDKIKTSSVENVGVIMEKNVQPKAQDAGIVINGTTGNTYAERNRQRTGETNHHLDHHQKTGHHRTDQITVG